MTASETAPAPAIAFEPPETVRCGPNAYRCGGVTYRLLRHLADQPRRSSTVRRLAVAVWGKAVGPEVSRVTVKGVLHRANDVLAGLGARERVTLDGDAVLLL